MYFTNLQNISCKLQNSLQISSRSVVNYNSLQKFNMSDVNNNIVYKNSTYQLKGTI